MCLRRKARLCPRGIPPPAPLHLWSRAATLFRLARTACVLPRRGLSTIAAAMPKRAADADAGAVASPAKKAPRPASAGRKRAPKVAYLEPAEVRRIEPAESMEAFAAALPPRSAEHEASTFKVMCW